MSVVNMERQSWGQTLLCESQTGYLGKSNDFSHTIVPESPTDIPGFLHPCKG